MHTLYAALKYDVSRLNNGGSLSYRSYRKGRSHASNVLNNIERERERERRSQIQLLASAFLFIPELVLSAAFNELFFFCVSFLFFSLACKRFLQTTFHTLRD